MILPFMSLFLLFTIIPVVLSFVLGFTYFDGIRLPSFAGVENYIRLFVGDDVFLKSVRITLVMALVTGPVGFIVCFFFAWLINEFPRRVRVLLTFLFFLPSLAGSSVLAMYQLIFRADARGIANGLLMGIRLIREPIAWFYDEGVNLPLIIVIQLWASLGAGFLTHIAGLQTIDPEIYESGVMDGIKTRFHEMYYLTIPMMGPFLFFSAIIQIAASFTVGQFAMALGGFPSVNYSLHTVVAHIQEYGTVRLELGYAASIAFVLTVAMLFIHKMIIRLFKPSD